MFKKFVSRIVLAETSEELWEIFSGMDGIDLAFQHNKISWSEHQMLLKLIEKIDKSLQMVFTK